MACAATAKAPQRPPDGTAIGKLIGAVGVSGASGQDGQIARAGIDALPK